MAAYSYHLLTLTVALSCVALPFASADVSKDSPFKQSGAPAAAAKNEALEFIGVTTDGKKTMVNLYDREAKHGSWIQEGKSSGGITVVKYDGAHDQVTIKRDGVEKTLALRSASGVVNGPAPVVTAPVPALMPSTPVTVPGATTSSTPAAGTTVAADGTTPAPATPTTKTRAQQEEEARMLVSDLLEIGIAQRRAYEEAQRKAAAGGQTQPPQPATPSPAQSAAPANSGSDQSQAAASPPPNGG
jgi:hypothetical protein